MIKRSSTSSDEMKNEKENKMLMRCSRLFIGSRCLALLFTDKYFSGFSDANSKTKKEKIFFDNFFRLDKIDNRSVETYGLMY